MEEWKQVVATNLSELRKANHLTQLQLAEQLHYSDKAVSKWERGESLPDLAVMKQLAEFYGLTIDDLLLTAEQRAARNVPPPDTEMELPAEDAIPDAAPKPRRNSQNRLMIAGMAVLLVWLIATMIFVVLDTVLTDLKYGWFLFVYSLPISAVICLVFNSIWFNPRHNYAIVSVLIWSVLGSIFMTFLEYRIWKLFLIGIPAQLIVIFWSRLRRS